MSGTNVLSERNLFVCTGISHRDIYRAIASLPRPYSSGQQDRALGITPLK